MNIGETTKFLFIDLLKKYIKLPPQCSSLNPGLHIHTSTCHVVWSEMVRNDAS